MQKGSKMSRESKEKMSKAHKGQIFTAIHRKRLSIAAKGKKRKPFSIEWRKKMSIARKRRIGKLNPSWRGGKKIDDGYTSILMPKHPFAPQTGYIMEHRLVMEAHIGRYLLSAEVVHHINGNRSDNRVKNFMLFKNVGYHLNFHRWGHCNPKGIIFDGHLM